MVQKTQWLLCLNSENRFPRTKRTRFAPLDYKRGAGRETEPVASSSESGREGFAFAAPVFSASRTVAARACRSTDLFTVSTKAGKSGLAFTVKISAKGAQWASTDSCAMLRTHRSASFMWLGARKARATIERPLASKGPIG